MGVCIHFSFDKASLVPSVSTEDTYEESEELKSLSMFSTLICKHHPKAGG